MLFAAAEALAGCLSSSQHKRGMVFPEIHTIREVSAVVAAAVITEAVETGLATLAHEVDMDDCEGFVRSKMYEPQYGIIAATENEALAKSPKYGMGIHDIDQPVPVIETRLR